MSHFIIKCKECKEVIGQCRCMSMDKEVIYQVCDKCKVNNDWKPNDLILK